MRAYVFTDQALLKHAGRFAWLSIDTEKAENAPFREKFPVEGLPTTLIIDPASEQVVLKVLGSADVAGLEKIFADAELAMRSPGGGIDDLLVKADKLYGERKYTEAAAAYREALAAGGAGWSRRGRVIESLTNALQGAGDLKGCVEVARKEAPGLPRNSSFVNVSVTGLLCAFDLPDSTADRAALEPLVMEGIRIPGLLADDRSSLYDVMVSVRQDRGDKSGATALAKEWIEFLEAEAAKATTPEARAAFDPHRVGAALALGDSGRAVPALEATERDLPGDYNAPARLSVLYRELGRYQDAIAASDRALAKVDGPRRIRVLTDRASTLEKMGDKGQARKAIEDAIRFAEGLPPGQRSDKTIASLKDRLAKLG